MARSNGFGVGQTNHCLSFTVSIPCLVKFTFGFLTQNLGLLYPYRTYTVLGIHEEVSVTCKNWYYWLMVIIIWEDEVEAQAQKGKVGGKNLKVIWKTYNFWIANNKWIWFCVCVCVCVCVCAQLNKLHMSSQQLLFPCRTPWNLNRWLSEEDIILMRMACSAVGLKCWLWNL